MRLLIILLFTCILTSGIGGQEHQAPVKIKTSGILIEHFDGSQGLSQGYVLSMVQDRAGYIWLGNAGGLDRYNGYNFQSYFDPRPAPHTLSSSQIYGVAIDQNNQLWAISPDLQIYCYRPSLERFHNLENCAALRDFKHSGSLLANSILIDSSNKVYFQFQSQSGLQFMVLDAGKYAASPKTCEIMRLVEAFPSLARHAVEWIHPARKGGLWVGTKDSTYLYDPKALKGLKDPLSFPIGLDSGSPGLRFSQIKNEAYRISGRTLYRYNDSLDSFGSPFAMPLEYNFSNKAMIDSRGRIWDFTHDERIIRLDPAQGQISYFVPELARGMRLGYYRFSLEDRDGNIWLTTNGHGVGKISLVSESIQRIWPDQYVENTSGFPYKFNSPGGHSVYDPLVMEKWAASLSLARRKNLSFSFLKSDVYQICHDGEARFYFAGENKNSPKCLFGLDMQKNELYEILSSSDTSEVLFFQIIYLDKNRDILFLSAGPAGDLFLNIFDPFTRERRQWAIPTRSARRDAIFILDFLQDHHDNYWFATYDGIFMWNGHTQKWRHFSSDKSDPASFSVQMVKTLCLDPNAPDQYIWAGTHGGGLFRMDMSTGACDNYTRNDGLSDNCVNGIIADHKGNFWISTQNGICLFDPVTLFVRRLGLKDGLCGLEFNGRLFSHARDGKILFGGVSGINVIDPNDFYRNSQPARVIFSSLKIFDKVVRVCENGDPSVDAIHCLPKSISDQPELVFNHDQSMITLGFELMDFNDAVNNRFRYKLVNLFDHWVELGNRNEIVLNNLSPGQYRLEVIGCNNQNIWSTQPASLSIIILPPWWASVWFRSLLICGILISIFMIYKYRMKKALEIEKLRNRIAQDLHDEIGSTLSSISLYSSALEKSKSDLSPFSLGILHKISENAGAMMEMMNDIVWTIRSDSDSLSQVINRIRAFSNSLGETGQFQVVLEVDEQLELLKLNMLQRKSIYLIAKEAINNAVKYSRCQHLYIYFRDEPGRKICMRIVDDGIGFDLSEMKDKSTSSLKGNGLRNMQNRADEIGASLRIQSIPGKGTSIELIFKH